MNRVTGISEGLLISFYISGLKHSLQRELLVSKPISLGDAFYLAHVTTSRLTSTMAPKSIPYFSAPRKENPKLPLLPPHPKVGVNSWTTTIPIKHRCPRKFLLLMVDNKDVIKQVTDAMQEDAMESGDISILNSLVGHGSPRSLQLWGMLGAGKVHILIDNGSTQNFVQPRVVELMRLPISGPNRVLRIQWLQKLGKVTRDYSKQTMEFTWSNQGYMLQGEEALRMKHISLHHNRALLETEDIYEVYELYNLDHGTEEKGSSTDIEVISHPDIKQLIAWLRHFSRKLMRFDFDIDYKHGASNLVADVLSRVFEDNEDVTTVFMAFSGLVVGLLKDLKQENETLDELC
nr:hypothetical protein [Tanacetum cinerariifolium]